MLYDISRSISFRKKINVFSRRRSVAVITSDSESDNPSSNLGGASGLFYFFNKFEKLTKNIYPGRYSRDRLVVRTLRCGRSNPGSNPGNRICFCDLNRAQKFIK